MNDPHVERLHFRLHTREGLSFASPPPVSDESAAFRVRLEDGMLTIEMKDHHATTGSARKAVESYLRAWEISTGLEIGPGGIRFEFEKADLIDRSPPLPGEPRVMQVEAECCVMFGGEASIHMAYGKYPLPPSRFAATPDVQTMWYRYQLYREGKEPLLAMAYACLTLLERSTGMPNGSRSAVCQVYNIEQTVRDKLGKIVSECGGPNEGRKLGTNATMTPLTEREKQWVEQVIKTLIRRKAEYDSAPTAPLPLITMANFVEL